MVAGELGSIDMVWLGVFIVIVLGLVIPTPYNFVLLPALLFLRLATWADDPEGED